MSWEDQGRQYHMWFGHGTAPVKGTDQTDHDGTGPFGRDEMSERFVSVAQGAIAALPADLRARAATRNDPATIERATALMRSWVRGAALGEAEFAERFLGRAANDPVTKELRAAAMGAAVAKSHAALAEAANHLANAMQGIGIDRWQRFLADAQERTNDPSTVAAVKKSQRSLDPSGSLQAGRGNDNGSHSLTDAKPDQFVAGRQYAQAQLVIPAVRLAPYVARGVGAAIGALGGLIITNQQHDDEKQAPPANPDPSSITPRPELPPLSGGRSGQNVPGLTGPPNSAIAGGGKDRIFITDQDGNVIADVTRDRVKPVIPGKGFGPKRAPTPQELDLLDKMRR